MQVLTSENSPLQIDTIVLPDSGGRIGLTICPGKRQYNAMSGRWNRDLDLDLDAIAHWGAGTVVSLIEDHEAIELGVKSTPERMPPGIEYLNLPIRDMGVPGAQWESRWSEVGPRLADQLNQGEAVLVHCKGGLGRSGTVAARLLVELGLSAEQAIDKVRQARPGAIETKAQELYVRQLDGGAPCIGS